MNRGRTRGTMMLRVGAATDTGRVRELNEDVYAVRAEQGLFVVCDGMGGSPAGEVASQIAVETVVEELNEIGRADTTRFAGGDGYLAQTSRLAAAVRVSNAVIYQRAQRDVRQAGMGTTLVGAWIDQHIASVAHVGDSRAYLWHGDRLEALTRDHSLVEAQVAAGVIGREESLSSDYQNVLVRVLGREPDVDVELNEVPVEAGDYLLLCSDGLTRMVTEAAMALSIRQWREPQRICDDLISAANSNGGADNITVVVIEVAEHWWRRLWKHRRPPA